jgi:hypothetical protein
MCFEHAYGRIGCSGSFPGIKYTLFQLLDKVSCWCRGFLLVDLAQLALLLQAPGWYLIYVTMVSGLVVFFGG